MSRKIPLIVSTKWLISHSFAGVFCQRCFVAHRWRNHWGTESRASPKFGHKKTQKFKLCYIPR